MNYEGQLFAQHHQPLGPTALLKLSATHSESLRITTTMQKIQAHDDDTLGTGSSNTGLDNQTDTFGREIMQHERDARRLHNATRGDARPVLKPRVRARLSDGVARREREEDEASRQRLTRAGSTGSNDSNPPLIVPREWGTRAKSHRGWMRKIREPSIVDTGDSGRNAAKGLLTPEEDAEPPLTTSYGGDNIWNHDDEHGAALENTPPSMKRARPDALNATTRDAHSTLRHIIDSEDQDFGELSLLTSTPATTKPVRNGLSRSDAEPIGRRPYTTGRRHDLLAERSPNRDTTHTQARGSALDNDDKRTTSRHEDVPRRTVASYAETRTARRTGLINNKENVSVNDTRALYSRTSERVTISDRTAKAVTFKQHQRPLHARNGSLHLLQRLATSLSPSPGRSSLEAVPLGGEELVSSEAGSAAHRNTHENDQTGPTQRVLCRGHRKSNGSQSDEEKSRAKLSHAASDEPKQDDYVEPDETPAPMDRPSGDKTPVVTGAWVDTPGPAKDTRPSLPSSNSVPPIPSSSKDLVLHKTSRLDPASREDSRAPHGNPNRPKSVLEEIVRDARKNSTDTFGDATLQSLEDIVHPNTDPTDTTLASDAGGAHKKDTADNLGIVRPLTQAEIDRREEDLAIEAMNRHLRAARTSIKDADRGLQRVENKWESTSHGEVSQSSTKSSPQPKQVTTIYRDRKASCEHCGGSYHSLWWGLWTELRSCFYTYDKNARYGVRITWPGLLVLAWLLWNLLENLLCYYYCHPLYTEFMIGYGVDPEAPRYPFVIPTLLFRPLRSVWKPVLKWLETSFSTVFYMVIGEPAKPVRSGEHVVGGWNGLSGRYAAEDAWTSTWTGRAATTAVAAAGRTTRSFVDAVDAVWGETMNDDEWL
jgi:hypothetical protein